MENAPITDEQHARQIQQGNSEIIAILIDRYYGPMVDYFYRMRNGDYSAVEGLAQATFLSAFGSLDRYRFPKSFRGWLYAGAAPLALDHDDQPVGDGANPVAATLALLPADQREALILRYGQGLHLPEIATVQRVRLGTLRTRMWAGLAGFKNLLAPAPEGPSETANRARYDEETNWLLERLMEDTEHPHLADHMLATARAICRLPAPPVNPAAKARLTLRLVQEHRARVASRISQP